MLIRSFADFDLSIEYVQGDPFAAPSRLRLEVPNVIRNLDCGSYENRVASADFALRWVFANLPKRCQKMGSGKSGLLRIDTPGQEILYRSAATVDENGHMTLRIYAGLPANGRRILADKAIDLLTNKIPRLVRDLHLYLKNATQQLTSHLYINRYQNHLRTQLVSNHSYILASD